MPNDFTNFIPEVWSKKVLRNLDNSTGMIKCVNKDYEGDIKSAGDTVKIRSFGNVTTQTYGGSISRESLTSPLSTLTIDQRSYFGFSIPTIDDKQSDINIAQGYLERAHISASIQQDTFLLGAYADVAAGNIVNAVGSPYSMNKDTIYAKFVEIAKTLKKANAVERGGKRPYVMINPDVEAVLLQAPEFIHATETGDKTIREGSIGRIANLDVMVSTNLQAISSKIPVLAGITDAITFANQVVELRRMDDQSSFSVLYDGLYVYGKKVTIPTGLALCWMS